MGIVLLGVLLVGSWIFAYELGKKDAINYMGASAEFINKIYGKKGSKDEGRDY